MDLHDLADGERPQTYGDIGGDEAYPQWAKHNAISSLGRILLRVVPTLDTSGLQ